MAILAGSSLLEGRRCLEQRDEAQQGRWPRLPSCCNCAQSACHIPESSGAHVPRSISPCSSLATLTQGPQLQGPLGELAGASGCFRGVAPGPEPPRELLRGPLAWTPRRLHDFRVPACCPCSAQRPMAHQTAVVASSRASAASRTLTSLTAPTRAITTALVAVGPARPYIAMAWRCHSAWGHDTV